MVKIIIADDETIMRETIHAVENRIYQKEDRIIYIESLEVARKILTPQRLKMLGIIKRNKPASLYALAKLMGKDFRAIHRDVGIMSSFGLIQKESKKTGKRGRTQLGVKAKEIVLTVPI